MLRSKALLFAMAAGVLLSAAACGGAQDGFAAEAVEQALLADVNKLSGYSREELRTGCVNTTEGRVFECTIEVSSNDGRIPVTVTCDNRSCIWRGDGKNLNGSFTPSK